jgi:type I restriction enzyme S subunit
MVKKNALVPALRFKEYYGDWLKKPIIDLCEDIIDCVNKTAPVVDYPTQYRMIRTSNVRNGKVNLEKVRCVEKTTYDAWTKRGAPLVGDLIFTREAPVGEIGMLLDDEGVFLGQRTMMYRADKTLSSGLYLLFAFQTRNCRKQIDDYSNGGTVSHMRVPDCAKILIPHPDLPEQQKIASFLSAVDEKIQQLTKKKALLEHYKKGVMQQLFSGQLSFKDENGNSFPNWELVGGNELFENISDKKHNSDLPILAITQDQGAIPRELINYEMTVTAASVASYKVVQVGDFVISLRTFQGGIEFSDYHGICSPAYIILRPSSDDVDREFYKFYLKTDRYIRQLQKNLEGIRDGKMISYKYFSEIKLPFPSLPEQQKISTCLSSIDTKIKSVNNQITQTQTFKTGLLQQMFV